MSKIPKLPEQIFEQFINDYKNAFEEELVSIILYGSAARGEYVYKKSDINFLIILKEKGIRELKKILPLIKRWQKSKVSTPLILTNEYILSSLDSFPIEFLSMRQNYKVVFGEDALSSVKINDKDLRLQCEREIRGKLLYLRESYLNSLGDARMIKQLIQLSLPAFTSIFSALLHLKKIELPTSKAEIFKLTTDEFEMDFSVFEKLIKLSINSIKLNKEQLNQLMEQYIEQIRKLTNIVDKL